MECRVHLCAQNPCSHREEDALHAVASAVIPRNIEFDLQDAAGKGPFARCATAAWLCGYTTMGVCGNVWKGFRKCLSCIFCLHCCCGASRRKKGRSRIPPESGTSTPRHDNSETESEGEEDMVCQAEAVAFLVNGKAVPLSTVPCKDAARGDKVKLLPSDAEVSSAEDLKHEDGNFYFGCCHHHRALYEGQAAKRTCAFEGCEREVKVSKGGLRLCKLHGAKEEKPKPSSRGRIPTKKSDEWSTEAIQGSEARFAPGAEGSGTSSKPEVSRPSPQASLLGKYLREVLEGKDETEALLMCASPGCGPLETWEELKEQATLYVTKLPRDYPVAARKAVVNLVTEECPVREWGVEKIMNPVDPVLDLARHSSSSDLARPASSSLAASPQEVDAHRGVEVLPPLSPPSEAPPPATSAASLYRPRGAASLPSGATLGNGPRQHDAYSTFAAISRPRHAGAYTDGEPPRMDETTKALQAIAKAVTAKDEAASHDKGKLASIGKVEERLVYLVRGCDALTVPLGKATVGKELYHSLRATSTQGRPQLRMMQFPVNINNRVAYGLASLSLGGKDIKALPDYCLSAADFPLTSEEEFDNWSGCSDVKLEKRPKPPMTLNAWYRNALREAWGISCVYGTEHYSSFEQAASYLLKLGEEHSYMWPAHAIFSVWEELWARYVEELKDLDRELRRAMKEESPSFERIRFFVTAPGDDGEPWLRLPRTFFLEDHLEYFQTDVIPRHNRLLSRACWQVALKKTPTGGLYGGKAGEGPEASESRPGPKLGKTDGSASKGLLGPPLTNKEAARALDHRPKEKKGARYLCWDHMCHRGCAKPSACPHAHLTAPKWESLDWAVQLQMIRRGGLRSRPKLTEQQAAEQMENIRKSQLAKNQEMINDGKRVKKVGEQHPSEEPTESKVGQAHEEPEPMEASPTYESAPAEFTSIFPTDQEEEMMSLLEGPDGSFFEDHDRGKRSREMKLEGELEAPATSRLEKMGQVEQTNLTEGFEPQLQTYLRNQLLLIKEAEPERVLESKDVRAALERARDEGCPSLSTAADEALQGAQSQRAGYSPNIGHLSQFEWADGVGTGVLSWEGGSWDVFDYGDKLHPDSDWPTTLLSNGSSSAEPEARQCLLLHCAAGYLAKKNGKAPSLSEVQKQTNLMRKELAQQAGEASRHLGDCPETLPRSEADLRVFVHDLLHWSHDKDYRTLASFPSSSLLGNTLRVVRMASDFDLSTEVIVGALSSGHANQSIYLLVHKGHMRLMLPRHLDREPPVIREVIAAGWECHLEAAHGSEATVRARDYLLCPRCSASEEIPRRAGLRPPSVLGLHLRSDAHEKLGGWTPSPLETAEVDHSSWSNQEIADWLGDQAPVFWKALEQGLDFLEVYAGTARASQAVSAGGGLAIHLGLNHGQDFRKSKDRSLGKALLQRTKPKHYWGSFPCTPFCAWIRLAILRNCDMTLRLKEGRLHLKYALELATLQVMDGRHAHLENPLTSMAWKEPLAITVLSDPVWLRVRLDQCQTGLSSPAGGLHLKPTLIRTTDPSMQQALNLTCPRLHSHDLVQGSATALSLKGPPLVHHELRGPLSSPLTPAAEKACREYLEYVTTHPYSKEAFKTGASLGSTVLKAAGGWEEANRGIRKTWVSMKGDHFEDLHSDFFDGLVDAELLAKARENAIWGISARYEGGQGSRVQCGPHPSLKEHLEEAAQQLWKDASKGRVLLCFDDGGHELEGVISVAMARVPKMLPDRTVSDKGRVIWDAKPVNAFCHKSRHPPALQPKHDEIARLIVWWQLKYPNTPILISKKDVSDAFKWIPVRKEDTRLFAADLPGGEFGAPGKCITVMYNSLTFGWSGAPGEYMLFAWLMKLGHSMLHPPDSHWNDPTAFRSLVLMDDAVLIEPKVGIRPWLSVNAMETCTKKTLGPGSINAAKDEVEGALETRKLIWGLMYDTENNTRTLPPQKLEKASYLLHLPEFDHGNQRIPLKLVQELRGNQQFWVSVLPSLKPLLSATNSLLGPPTADGMANPKGNAEQQRRAWVRFWEAIELQRLLVDNRSEWGVRFTHPMTEALSLRELLALPGGKEKVVWASGDATLDRVGAVDWTNREAFSLEVITYQRLLEQMEREALEDASYPSCESRPGGHGVEEEEPGRMMVALTELLATVLLAVSQCAKWRGKVVLYMGDNQVVVRWINSRQAKHPFASYLLQLLAALEACYGFHMHTAYLRTYHNVVADALTRKDADDILQQEGLAKLPPPDQSLQKFLDRGWQRRALIWAGQADADTQQACRLSETRTNRGPFLSIQPLPNVLEVQFFMIQGLSEGYLPTLLASGAEQVDRDEVVDEQGSRRASRPDCASEDKAKPLALVCLSIQGKKEGVDVSLLAKVCFNKGADLVWADGLDKTQVEAFSKALASQGYAVEVKPICGRSLRDQVWWKRWVSLATAPNLPVTPFPCVTADDEPCTPPLVTYPMDWWLEDGGGDKAKWEEGTLKLDSTMPFLGATKPKPAGTLQRPDEGRALVWDPKRPLPGLHEGSWDTTRKDRLLLLGRGPDGPAARTILWEEARSLLVGKKSPHSRENQPDTSNLVNLPPRSLPGLAVQWAACQSSSKVGVCKLRWEEESLLVMKEWLKENPATFGASTVGGKKNKKKEQFTQAEKAMKSMSYVLRHAAGTPECPITEEGWVRWNDLIAHESCRKYGGWTLWNAIEADAKDRVVSKSDEEGEWWVAAWSGHTQERVIGPAAIVPRSELPTTLVHGSYSRHSASIQKKGLVRGSRDLHFHDASQPSGKWRLDLETRIDVDVQRACDLGCEFRKTGNQDGEEAAASSSSRGADNPAALDLSKYRAGTWTPKLKVQPVTEAVVEVTKSLGKNLPDDCTHGAEVDPDLGTVHAPGAEACIAPGTWGDEDDECDWSAEDSDVEVVTATPAAKMEEGLPSVKEEETHAGEGPSSSGGPTQDGMEETPLSAKGLEEVNERKEEILEEAEPPRRRKKILFGSAHLHLLRAVADADSANWESLQSAIGAAPATAKVKSELVERLGQLAELRVESIVGAEKKADEYIQKTKQYSEAETEYRKGLNEEMLRLEKMNPVGPRTAVPLVSDNRLRREIEAGKPIWQARRDHRARERAARKRLEEAKAVAGTAKKGSVLEEASTLGESGEALDSAFAESAKANLAELKQLLKEEAAHERADKKRKPDSARRRKIKKQKRRERENTQDDAERDTNHAIAHQRKGPEARFSPGFFMLALCCQLLGVEGSRPLLCEEDIPPEGLEEIHEVFGVLVLLAMALVFVKALSLVLARALAGGSRRLAGETLGEARRVSLCDWP
eukprot:Skav236324  [mRNA]  locus=scaffold97:181652:191974:+ [translate_table: standard]